MMEQAIKAIETEYNGYRFRSRLEARWAVFFDEAGIKYRYEDEGFEVGEMKYLPDFYLPDIGCHVEVKPSANALMENGTQEKLAWMIDYDGPLSNGLLILGQIPAPYKRQHHEEKYPMAKFNYYYWDKGIMLDEAAFMMDLTMRGVLIREHRGVVTSAPELPYPWCGAWEDGELYSRVSNTRIFHNGFYWDIYDTGFSDTFIENCFAMARTARFEHGESGSRSGNEAIRKLKPTQWRMLNE